MITSLLGGAFFACCGRGWTGGCAHTGRRGAASSAVAKTRTRVLRGFMIFLGSFLALTMFAGPQASCFSTDAGPIVTSPHRFRASIHAPLVPAATTAVARVQAGGNYLSRNVEQGGSGTDQKPGADILIPAASSAKRPSSRDRCRPRGRPRKRTLPPALDHHLPKEERTPPSSREAAPAA